MESFTALVACGAAFAFSCYFGYGRAPSSLAALLFGAVALGEAVEHLGEAHGEQAIGLEALLVAEQVQLHQQLIHQAPVDRRDHIGESAVEGTLAIRNSEAHAHVLIDRRAGTLAREDR